MGLKLLLHLVTNLQGGYGYFRDELYYLACSDHPDLGYVDHPPLSIYILTVSRLLFGDSLFALRLLPALAGAASVLLTAMIARALGGKPFAQGIAAFAATVSPVFMGMHTIYSMNAFEILVWAVSVYLLVRIVVERRGQLWITLGLVLGLGLLNKIGIFFLGFGLAAGLLLTKERIWFKTPWPWICAAIAFILFSPYVIWNLNHGFAHVEFILNASSAKYSGLTRTAFLADQLLINNPFAIPVWGAGIVYLLFSGRGGRFRLLGFLFVGAAAVLLANGTSKAIYLAPAFVILFGAGGVALERLASAVSWMRVALPPVLFLGLAIVPLGLPILPVDTYIRYASLLGVAPSTAEGHQMAELPQFYADMFGWKEQVVSIAAVYSSLPEEEQRRCVIFGENYGRAAAVDFFGKEFGLPAAVSGHNSYWLWGPGSQEPGTVILLDRDPGALEEFFGSVEAAGTHYTPYAVPYENNLTIFVCRGLKIPLSGVWERLRHYE